MQLLIAYKRRTRPFRLTRDELVSFTLLLLQPISCHIPWRNNSLAQKRRTNHASFVSTEVVSRRTSSDCSTGAFYLAWSLISIWSLPMAHSSAKCMTTLSESTRQWDLAIAGRVGYRIMRQSTATPLSERLNTASPRQWTTTRVPASGWD